MSSRLKLAGICFAAAFALAACGGGGGGTATMPPPTTTPPPPAGPSGLELALAAREAGDAAATAATQAVDDATKYAAMLDAVSNMGDSAMAGENAQKVLDARSNLETAIMDAEAAVEAAEEAMTAAEGDEALVAALDAAIMAANAQIKAAKATLAGSDLATETRKVTGAPTDTGYPKAASATAKAVAMKIDSALDTTTTTETLVPGSTRASFGQMAAGNEANNSKGYDWATLAGEMLGLTLRYRRVQRPAGDAQNRVTQSILGAIVNGQAVPTTDGTGTDLTPPIGDTVGDTAGISVTMFGLPGMLYCQSGTCTVKDGKLYGAPFESTDPRGGPTVTVTPTWYFQPANPFENRYVADSANPGMYMVETGYVNYGYWISVDTSDPVVTSVNTYAAAVAGTNTTGLDLDFPSAGNPTEGATATYSGSALGVASRQQGIESGTRTFASGEFTADVNLTATFGNTATLVGKVNNFRGGVADSRWSATLGPTDLTADANFASPGAVTGDTGETAGAWTAQGYGATGKRPSGFFGTFNANFTNGRAAGGYAATRDKN